MMKSAVVFLLWWQITASQDILDPGGNGPDIVRQVYFEHNPLPRAGPQQRHAMRQNPLENMVGGLLLSGLSSFLLWWNEGRAVRDAQMLRRAEQSVVEIEGSDSHDDHEGKLVHTTGQLSTQRGLKDYDYGIHRPDALQLERTTQSYLWMEQRDEKRTRVNNRESRVEVNFRYHRG